MFSFCSFLVLIAIIILSFILFFITNHETKNYCSCNSKIKKEGGCNKLKNTCECKKDIYLAESIKGTNCYDCDTQIKKKNKIKSKKFLYLKVGKYKNKIKAHTKIDIQCNYYKTELKFKYCEKEKHNAVFIVKNVKGLLSEATKGVAILIKKNKHNIIYNYISSYNRNKKKLFISLFDQNGDIVLIKGCVKIKLIMCSEEKICNCDDNNYKHPKNKTGGMCR